MRNSTTRFTPWLMVLALLFAVSCAPTTAPSPATAPDPDVPAAPAKPAEEAIAPTEAVSFEGKTVTLLVPYSPGGSADLLTRQLAPAFENYLPGNPTVLVQNMPGGGGISGWNWIHQVAPKDGTVIGYQSSVIFTTPLFSADQIQFELDEIRFLGSVSEPSVSFVHSGLGVRNTDEILSQGPRPLQYGDIQRQSTRGLFGHVFLRLLDVDHGFVTGFPSSAESRASLLRGDLHMTNDSLSGYFQVVVPMIEEGEMYAIAQQGSLRDGNAVRDPRLPDVPTYMEEVLRIKGEDSRRDLDFRALVALGNMSGDTQGYFYPPGVPDEIVNEVGLATARIFEDPQVQADFERLSGFPIVTYSAAEVESKVKNLSEMMQQDPEAVEEVVSLALEGS